MPMAGADGYSEPAKIFFLIKILIFCLRFFSSARINVGDVRFYSLLASQHTLAANHLTLTQACSRIRLSGQLGCLTKQSGMIIYTILKN